jgi:hypothetical protein
MRRIVIDGSYLELIAETAVGLPKGMIRKTGEQMMQSMVAQSDRSP